ncbi:MAG: DUF952 domain-containing protein [Chloroflexia bacterium]|jgi:uncharacterized protein (DUF952 family)|nr:DUF952 domain-containing protein [Chloroflexia bacterium]
MTSQRIILHITTRRQWQQALESGVYTADSLETEGFIHCSLPKQVVFVANSRYRGETGLILLRIDSDRAAPEIRYEGEIDRYPHIYGPLNTDAVIDLLDFPPENDGRFILPAALSEPPAV